jgi:hypothetical protein
LSAPSVILMAATLGFEKNFITSPIFCSGMDWLLSASCRDAVRLPGSECLFPPTPEEASRLRKLYELFPKSVKGNSGNLEVWYQFSLLKRKAKLHRKMKIAKCKMQNFG